MGVLEEGMEIHKRVVKNGFVLKVMVFNSLLYIYVKHGIIQKACELFDKMHDADIILWIPMIVGYAKVGFFGKALENFR